MIAAITVAATAQTAPKPRRFSFGGRITGYPLSVLPDGRIERTQETPPVSTIFTTTSDSGRAGIGPSIEFAISRSVSVSAELLFHRAGYEQVTETYQGTDNSDTSEDERLLTTVTERTKASFWDIPVMIRYHGLRSEGWLSRVCISGGGSLRLTTNIRTGTETVHPDDETSYNGNRVSPARRNLPGVTAGIGFRYIDDYNFKLTPEVRYTRWLGASFASDSTQARRNQIEVGIAITF
jgi:hypothetical protein